MIFAGGNAEGALPLRRLWYLDCEASAELCQQRNKKSLPCNFLAKSDSQSIQTFMQKRWQMLYAVVFFNDNMWLSKPEAAHEIPGAEKVDDLEDGINFRRLVLWITCLISKIQVVINFAPIKQLR